MTEKEQPGRPGGGRPMLMLVLLLLVVSIFAGWAFFRNPPDTPSATAAGAPTDGTAGASKQ